MSATREPFVAEAWRGHLSLELERRGSKTIVSRRRHHGPLLVQRPFHEPDGGCQVYVLHPPGGIVGGDELSIECVAGLGAQALFTTPAATKIYRSPARTSLQQQRLSVGPGAVLEWLPQETIVYDGAQASLRTRVDLESGAHFVGWETICLGHDSRGFTTGRFEQRWQLLRQGHWLWSERSLYEAGGEVARGPWGLAGRPVVGTLVATGASAPLVEALRARHAASERDWLSVTQLGEVLICRYLGYSAEAARRFFCASWSLLRQQLSGRGVVPPRVWAT